MIRDQQTRNVGVVYLFPKYIEIYLQMDTFHLFKFKIPTHFIVSIRKSILGSARI